MSNEVVLTIDAVTDPTSMTFGTGVINEALKIRAEKAQKAYVDFAGNILDVLANKRARHAQAIRDLEAAIATEKKSLETLSKAQDAVNTRKGLFPLAAALGMKESAIAFAKTNSIVVPASTDDVWKAE